MIVTKYVGETTSELSNRLKTQYGYDKIAICGKLDPMARGVVRILINENTKLMNSYLNSIKTYRFQLVIGVKTDTDDIMGVVTNIANYKTVNINTIKSHIVEICSRKIQHFHPFSAIKVKIDGLRKSLHYWTLAGKITKSNLPRKEVSVEKLTIHDSYRVDINAYYKEIINRLTMVSSSNKETFRINQITSGWSNTLKLLHRQNITSLQVLPIELTVSSGFYIRMLAYYLYEDYNIISNIYDIHRIIT